MALITLILESNSLHQRGETVDQNSMNDEFSLCSFPLPLHHAPQSCFAALLTLDKQSSLSFEPQARTEMLPVCMLDCLPWS